MHQSLLTKVRELWICNPNKEPVIQTQSNKRYKADNIIKILIKDLSKWPRLDTFLINDSPARWLSVCLSVVLCRSVGTPKLATKLTVILS